MTEERPWGRYQVLGDGIGWKVKRLLIDPSQRFSLQYHRNRSEFWVVINGRGIAIVGQSEKPLSPGEIIHVPQGVLHRASNMDRDVPLEIIEVQLGEMLSEEDVIRIEDDYGRMDSPSG